MFGGTTVRLFGGTGTVELPNCRTLLMIGYPAFN